MTDLSSARWEEGQTGARAGPRPLALWAWSGPLSALLVAPRGSGRLPSLLTPVGSVVPHKDVGLLNSILQPLCEQGPAPLPASSPLLQDGIMATGLISR